IEAPEHALTRKSAGWCQRVAMDDFAVAVDAIHGSTIRRESGPVDTDARSDHASERPRSVQTKQRSGRVHPGLVARADPEAPFTIAFAVIAAVCGQIRVDFRQRANLHGI